MFNDTKSFSFLGIPSQQMYADLAAWEIFFRDHRIKSIIELGTGRGGMALFFLLWAMQKNALFWTYDLEKHKKLFANRLAEDFKLIDHFRVRDVLKDHREISKNIAHPAVVYCDAGNKAAEIALYSRLLSSEDFIAVHDFTLEIKAEDLNELPLKEINHEVVLSLGSITRFFQII